MTTKPPSADLVKPPSTQPEQPAVTLADVIRRNQPAIAASLPKTLSADRFTRVAITALRNDKTGKLAACTPGSFMSSLLAAAQLGLEPNGPLQHAFLIPFGTECTFMLGYRGIIELARRAGVTVVARSVHENDAEFDVNLGAETITHRPAIIDRGQPVAWYATAKWDSGQLVQLATLDDIERHRSRSRTAASASSPWTTDFDAMARKTAVRMLAPFLPAAIDLAVGLAAEDGNIVIDTDLIDIDEEETK